MVAELGGETLALYLAGGATGAILDDLLRNIGVTCHCIPIAGYTRIAHAVFERPSSQEYHFVPEGPEVSEVEWDACLSKLATLDFDYVVVSGSLPRGLPDTAYGGVVDIAAAKGACVVLDTSGNALKATLGKGVFLVKPNRGELEDLVGHPLPQAPQLVAAARTLIELALKPQLKHHFYHLSAGPARASTFTELDAAMARGRGVPPTVTRYRQASLDELDAMSGEYQTRLGPCHPRIMQRAIRLYGSFAALNMTFRNEHLADEGMPPAPPFASYADLCAASTEGITIADQMMADFK